MLDMQSNLYKQKIFLCGQAFLLFIFSLDSWPVPKCNIFHLEICSIQSVSMLGKSHGLCGTDRVIAVCELGFYLFEYLFCCDLEAHQNWISRPATLRGSTNTCGAVTDLCERAARSSK